MGWRLVCGAFLLAGALERLDELAGEAIEQADALGLPLALATGRFVRAWPRFWQGRISDALADVEAARDARDEGWRQFVGGAAALYALCLIERGELVEAEAVLAEDRPLDRLEDIEDVVRAFVLAELRLAQGRPDEAYELASRVGTGAEEAMGHVSYWPWRAVAAQAQLARGDRGSALALAEDAAEQAKPIGTLHLRVGTLRVLGMCESGECGLDTLRAAVDLAAAAPMRLERIRALVELGSALRRSNQRAAAREPLGRALDLARYGGALVLQERARSELVASGARPRCEALSGPDALTPSERRVAELAGAGHSNRAIAATLFVTPKTVEYHLSNAYRKLKISTRGQLPQSEDQTASSFALSRPRRRRVILSPHGARTAESEGRGGSDPPRGPQRDDWPDRHAESPG